MDARHVPPSGRRDPRGPRVRARRPRRGPAHAALGPREHRPAVVRARSRLGPRSTRREEKRKVAAATAELQIDTRAASEVRRLSGGNQQKVTIARWVAHGVRTLLCFDPTRGIDIRTKRQIYHLLRELAAAGAAVLLYTSELKEIQLACDRADRHLRRPGRGRDRPSRKRTSRPSCERPTASADARARGGRRRAVSGSAAEHDAAQSRRAPETRRPTAARRSRMTRRLGAARPAGASTSAPGRASQRWTVGLFVLLVAFLFTKVIQPSYGAADLQILAIARAAARVRRRRSGHRRHLWRHGPLARRDDGAHQRHGRVPDAGPGRGVGRHRVAASSCSGSCSGRSTGRRRGDARAGHRRDAGDVVRLGGLPRCSCSNSPGGGAALWLKALVDGSAADRWVPKALVFLVVAVGVVWIPLRRSTPGLSMYAIGSDRLAAFRSGVPVGRTKVVAYALAGLFAALGGLGADREHGHRHAGAGALHARERRGHRARRREPRRRAGRAGRTDHRGLHPGPRSGRT